MELALQQESFEMRIADMQACDCFMSALPCLFWPDLVVVVI